MREVKLAATLRHLVDEGEYRGNRRQVCADLGITPAALSQYINGQTTPSIEKLIALADLFKVSLDYLMFGEDVVTQASGALEYGPMARYVEVGVDSVRAGIAAQSAFITKVGTILAETITEQIDAAAQAASKRPTTLQGMLDREQILELERYSSSSTIVAVDLSEDVIEIDSNIERGVAPSNTIAIVADNLIKKRAYRYVLSPGMRDVESVIERYRALLRRLKVKPADLRRCTFSIAREDIFVSFGIYELDVVGLRQRSPILHQYIEDYIGSDGRIGYIESPSSPSTFFLMDTYRLRTATREFTRLAAIETSG
ncbi:helix-turn-helix domain-containing protein [Nocardia macrotermitis]|uniref:HTH cro/C1-type domain-containing protein n=1 Tax=Nocardia macrotermitis TaxID=2585198 RepID=A0A7K0D9L1_9NOCA|nr:helix-turn-helix domain-containing protein [Nocardia macrotermitis]MQY22299.1 hypothetical protein [Nocardia macrotermitis]